VQAGGFAIWITGLPASGKSTIARALAEKLRERGIRIQILESDEMRKVFTPKPTYSEEERESFYNSMAYVGKLLVQNGVNVIFDATANRKKYRESGRNLIEKFMTVYVKCPLDICMKRDPKGIYKSGLQGKAGTVPGLQSPYEEPENPEVVVFSDREKPEECVEMIFLKVQERFL